MNWNFAALLTSFSQVKIVNEDLINWPGASMTVVIDIGGERINVAALKVWKSWAPGRGYAIACYEYEIATETEGITALLSKIESAPQPCASKLPFVDAIADGRFPTFAQWVKDSEHYAAVMEYDRDMFAPGRNWTNRAKRALKLDIHNMIADYLRAADEFIAGEPAYSLHPEIDEAIARIEEQEKNAAEPAQSVGIVWDNPDEFEAMCEEYAAKNRAAMEAAQEPAQAVAEVEPTETTVEPMTAREQKMRGDLECVLAYVRWKLEEYDAEGCQVDDQGEPIDREKVKLGEEVARFVECTLAGQWDEGSDHVFELSLQEWEHLDTLRGDIEIDFSKFRAQVSDFRRHHYNDGAWDVPAGSSIDAECERIESMLVLGQLKSYLDHHMGPGEFWDQVDHYLRGDHRPSPEDMDPDDVLKFVLEFSAMQTGNGRGSSLLCTQEADEILVQMNDDSAYLQRFTDRAREIMLDRMLDAAVPAAR